MQIQGGDKGHSVRRAWSLRLLWLVTATTVAVTSLLPATSEPMQLLSELPVSDKVLHITAYTLLACIPTIHDSLIPATLQLVATIGIGIGLEFVQEMFSRSFEVADMVADGWGVGCGIAVGLLIRWRWGSRTPGTGPEHAG